ncbi:MAG TPA: hypothetical protein VF736_07635 [Pyrinomonadaceae bacterium]|jgi:hypothetical protein
MSKAILTCLAALALLLSAAVRAGLAKGDGGGQPREEVVARVRKAQAERRRVRVTFKKEFSWFKEEVTLTGRVGEARERGFTFEPDDKDDVAFLKGKGMVAAVLYDDVASVRYPSKMKKFLRGVGIGAMGVGAFFIVMPVYAVEALLGELPSC